MLIIGKEIKTQDSYNDYANADDDSDDDDAYNDGDDVGECK